MQKSDTLKSMKVGGLVGLVAGVTMFTFGTLGTIFGLIPSSDLSIQDRWKDVPVQTAHVKSSPNNVTVDNSSVDLKKDSKDYYISVSPYGEKTKMSIEEGQKQGHELDLEMYNFAVERRKNEGAQLSQDPCPNVGEALYLAMNNLGGPLKFLSSNGDYFNHGIGNSAGLEYDVRVMVTFLMDRNVIVYQFFNSSNTNKDKKSLIVIDDLANLIADEAWSLKIQNKNPINYGNPDKLNEVNTSIDNEFPVRWFPESEGDIRLFERLPVEDQDKSATDLENELLSNKIIDAIESKRFDKAEFLAEKLMGGKF